MKRIFTLAICALAATSAFAQAPAGPRPSGAPRQAGIIPGQTPTSPAFELYFEPATAEVKTPDAEGFVGRWLLLDPIAKPNRSNTVFTDSYIREAFAKEYFPGQLTVLPKDGQKVKVEVDVTPAAPFFFMPGQTPEPPQPKFEKRKLQWHALDSKLFNVKLFRFAAGLQKPEVYGVVFWAATVIECEEDIDNIRMAVGSNSASMWWLNGQEAVILSGDRRMVKDDCVSKRLSLKKGRNVIWGAVINGPGMSDFCLRFIDEEGNPVTNYTITTK